MVQLFSLFVTFLRGHLLPHLGYSFVKPFGMSCYQTGMLFIHRMAYKNKTIALQKNINSNDGNKPKCLRK